MADFSSFSDSDDEKAVEDILSQAMDSCVLEQVAAVNCAGFDPESVLPTHIEARFRKLKSFPAPSMRHTASSTSNLKLPSTKSMERSTHQSTDEEEEEEEEENKKPKQEQNEYVSSPSNSSNSSPMKETLSKRVLKSKEKPRSSISPSDSSNPYDSYYSSPSPPKKPGCFWCSSKKKSRRRIPAFLSEWGSDGDEELFSDLNMFSKKDREKVLKKAMKDEEKISREAEKIVNWAKQVSGRK